MTHRGKASGSRRSLQRWSWLLMLVSGALAYLLVLYALALTDNPNFLPSLLLLGSLVVPASVLTFAATRAVQQTPAWKLCVVALAGGVIGTIAAGTVEYDVLRQLDTLSMLAVALIEESAKLIVPLAVLLLTRDRRSASGVVIGIASGAGFASLETMGYGLQALMSTGSIAAVDQTLLLRAMLSPAGHIAWTGVTAAGLWQIPGARHSGRAIGQAVVIFAVVFGLHAAWDGSDNIALRTIVAVVSVAGLLVTIAHTSRETAKVALTEA